ncbi:MAG: geranylgeranyl reductase family protein [Coriobacteriia bacterium]|nr:geranylgeranyl reductase family protein [Coriobacteriia bacterium]MCL2750365.1 geranylgeranyl reductase family protein [Coriobacteriia bacterium]
MRKHQVVIVGGGVGGSSTALHMARAGLDVLMVEKDNFPRDKPCGDGIVQSVHPLLDSMGILDDLVKNGYQCTGTIFSDPNQNMYTYHYEEGAFALAIPRFIGDDIMNKAAVNSGIDYLENFEATKVLFERGQAVGVRGIYNGVVVELEADLVVLADGGHSMLARQCGFFEENPDYVFYGIRGYFEGIRGLSDVIEFHYPHEMFMPAGYTWIFPLGKTKGNVGVFITETALNNTGMTIEELLWWWRDTTEIGGLRLGEATQIGDIKGWRLPSGKHQPIHGAGVLAVGDCANMIEPLFGGGYPHAVTAGVCAAKVAREAVDANDFSKEFLGKYVEYVNEALGSGYAIQELLRKQVFGTTKDIQELIDFSIEKFEGKRLSGGDAMAIFLKERRDFKGATKSAYSK